MNQTHESKPDAPHHNKRPWHWWEYGLVLVAIAGLAYYPVKFIRQKPGEQVLEPTGIVSADLEPTDRVPLERGAAADCNVLVITIDTARADHIGCYGNSGVRTPVIDSLARNGVLFAKAFTPSPSTLSGHSSIFTGLYPYRHGARANGSYHLGLDNTTLAEVLKANGYATGAFIGAYVLDSRFGLDQGFDVYDDDLTKGVVHDEHMYRERPAPYVNEAALQWIETVADRKFFAWIHYFEPHRPHVPPQPFRDEYSEHPYDGEIAYIDHEIGMLLSALTELGRLDNTLIVVTSDHGEGLGEHGEQTHSLFLYDSTLHTPLILGLPSKTTGPLGKVVHRPVSIVDVFPTVLDLIGLETNHPLDGVSLLRGPEAHAPAIYAETISTLVMHGWSPLFVVRQQDVKYIHAPRPELYDLSADPKELTNLFDQRPQQAAAMAALLESHIGDDTYGTAALAQRIRMDDETAINLNALGYVGSVREDQIDALQASKRDPKDMVPHWERVHHAANRLALGQFKEAIKELEDCLASVPEDVQTVRLLMRAYLTKGDLDRADQMARRALEHDNRDPVLYVLFGKLELYRRGFEEAKHQYHKALELDPNYAPAYVALGQLYADTVGPDRAVEFFRRAIELDPGTTGPDAYCAMGQMYLWRLQLGEAREAFTKALELGELNGAAHAGLAWILIQEGRQDESLEKLKLALRYAPNHLGALSTLATLYNKRNDPDKAIDLAQRALDISPNYELALNVLGSAFRAKGNLAAAKSAFQRALVQAPRFLPSILGLARLHLSEQELDEAATLFRRALAINPRQPSILVNLGTYEASRQSPEKALELYRRAIEIAPDFAVAHRYLGALLHAMGRSQEALTHLERTLELDPNQPGHEEIAEVIEQLRRAEPGFSTDDSQ